MGAALRPVAWPPRRQGGGQANGSAGAGSTVRSSPLPRSLAAQRAEAFAEVLRQHERLLPGGEVATDVMTDVLDQLRVRPLCPGFRSGVDLVGKDGHGHGDLDVLDVEEASRRGPAVVPVE